MQVATNLPPITVSSRDLARLEQLLDSPGLRHVPAALALGRELERATVLAPVGSALLGLSVGSVIDWQAPGGRSLRVRVAAIRYQPEAAGDLNR